MSGVTLWECIICKKFLTVHCACIKCVLTNQTVRNLKIFQWTIKWRNTFQFSFPPFCSFRDRYLLYFKMKFASLEKWFLKKILLLVFPFPKCHCLSTKVGDITWSVECLGNHAMTLSVTGSPQRSLAGVI